ncbi:MAG: sodium:calcium antiporter [Acidimicrobiales bacterium]
MPGWVVPAFVAGALVSLFASARLVAALARVGAHFGLAEVVVGLVAALAADGPELTSALAAQLSGHRAIGVGVLFGSNVFNIAALLGVGSLVAGRVVLHRRVVALEGVTALAIAGCGLALVTGGLGPVAAAPVTFAVFIPYVAVSALPSERLPVPSRTRTWLAGAVKEEAEEVSQAYPTSEGVRLRRSVSTAAVALVTVVAASVLMEHAASVGGPDLGLPEVVTGAVVLAAVTSLPNAVAALYLARRGKGAAMLSEAFNSNTINVVGGLVLPAALGGLALGHPGAASVFAGAAYAGITLLAAALAYAGRGVSRWAAASLVGTYAAFLGVLVALA